MILGGGPAGATAALLLSQWGHRVTLLTRRRPARTVIAESLPPSCGRIFRHLGIEDAIEAAGFQRSTGNTVWWGDRRSRVERFPDGARGHQVSNARLEQVLLELAEAAGARVHGDCTVRARSGLGGGRPRASRGAGVAPGDPARTGPEPRPSLHVAGASSDLSLDLRPDLHSDLNAAWVLDATGRAGILGRRWRRRVEGLATLALTARFEASDWELDDPSHTLVESYGDGWAWSVPLSARERFAAVMVDPRRTDLRRDADRETLFRAELAKTRALSHILSRARALGPAQACDASGYTSARFCGPGFFLLGDAGSFIDPLSSYGVKKAMTSGWLAAVCVHTCLLHPEREPHVLELFASRERQVFDSFSRDSARYSELAAAEHRSAFWSERARAEPDDGDLAGRELGRELDPALLREDPQVRAWFAHLLRAERLDLRRGRQVEIAARGMVEGHQVVLADHLVCPWAPRGVRFLRGVDLTRLVSLAPQARTVPDLLGAYDRSGVPAPPPDLLSSLAVCLAKGILEPAGAD